MLGSFASLAGALALFLVASVNAQNPVCGGLVTNGTGTFIVKNYDQFTVLTIYGLNNNPQSENYLLDCSGAVEKVGSIALQAMGLESSVKQFKVPVQKALVTGTFTSSYVELAGAQSNILVLQTPIVSPCLQAKLLNNTITPFDVNKFEQYNTVDVGFREDISISQLKDVWMPMSIEVEPLLRVEYIKAVSLFFGYGARALTTYNEIIETYNLIKVDMQGVPEANRRRIGWVKYDFSRNSWQLRNTAFTRGIIRDAAGIPFPLNGDKVTTDIDISPSDFKILVSNADIIIDQTEFDGRGDYRTVYSRWLALAGFTEAAKPRVLENRQVYSIDNTVNKDGVNDYQYRMPSRPDLLLRDLIAAQYPEYDPEYRSRFLNNNFPNDGGATNNLGPENCDQDPTATNKFKYNSGDITKAPRNFAFTGLPAPPQPSGGGIYGAGGDSQGGGDNGGGGSKTTSIIIAVVCVAAVLGAAFAFAFYKWSRRAKEDRFIELEEEMNNEIPLN
ncbi:hypothetical protein BGZ96_007277 [Linnemannia gamsii]|uniref:Uncharacterized protein n=1 Tax=Linnemannia gamsii TaxID=64522 RepID=A0ABQ7KEQ9_9FUNG|nr:hypothetical protein BGZ96_007277 [Linnemannia gamsii]